MKKAAFAFALLLAACETVPTGGTTGATGGGASIPATPIELGDWRNATAADVLAAFEQTAASRYGEGSSLSAAVGDLRRNEFNCGAAPPDETGRGDPPEQVCRRTMTAGNCTHTWQVHLFAAAGALTRTRGLYDRRCGGDGLLGGPG